MSSWFHSGRLIGLDWRLVDPAAAEGSPAAGLELLVSEVGQPLGGQGGGRVEGCAGVGE
jgi:hypothetical protein